VNHLLPIRLAEILESEPDVVFGEKLKKVHSAAAAAIEKMGELDLIRFENVPVDATADLSLWEEVAPVVASTISDMNALLAEVDINFPPGDMVVDPKHNEIDVIIQDSAKTLKVTVGEFGMRVRDPSVVGDRWNLIAELQGFRGRFRKGIGSMVYSTASVLSDCRRADVEPGFEEVLSATLVLRSTTSDLRRLMSNRMHKVAEATSEDLIWHVQQMEKELGAFGKTAAWRFLRAQDKKTFLAFRVQLGELTEKISIGKIEVLQILEPFVEFIEGLSALNRREILVEHDREVQAGIGVILETAMSASSVDQKYAAFADAVAQAQSLYGRSRDFDTYLRKLRKAAPALELLDEELDAFVMLLAQLSAS
jgi:hypothetical protein